jgi:hypothetical protein
MLDLFELAWGLRNADEHGADLETQRMTCLATAEWASRRLYSEGDSLPPHERFPFNDPMEDVLTKTVSTQESWVAKTEVFLSKALRQIKRQKKMHNHFIPEYHGAERTPRIDWLVSWSGLFPFTFSPSLVSFRELSELADASFLFHNSFISTAGDGLDSRRRVVFIQRTKIRFPAFRAAGVIMTISF